MFFTSGGRSSVARATEARASKKSPKSMAAFVVKSSWTAEPPRRVDRLHDPDSSRRLTEAAAANSSRRPVAIKAARLHRQTITGRTRLPSHVLPSPEKCCQYRVASRCAVEWRSAAHAHDAAAPAGGGERQRHNDASAHDHVS